MDKTFSEIKLFQVKPEKERQFELLVEKMLCEQRKQTGCIGIKYTRRFYTIAGVVPGEPPRELKKIVKCIKYYSFWEFDSRENYGTAIKWLYEGAAKSDDFPV